MINRLAQKVFSPREVQGPSASELPGELQNANISMPHFKSARPEALGLRPRNMKFNILLKCFLCTLLRTSPVNRQGNSIEMYLEEEIVHMCVCVHMPMVIDKSYYYPSGYYYGPFILQTRAALLPQPRLSSKPQLGLLYIWLFCILC